MSETYKLRIRFLNIARLDKGKVEDTKNRAPWISKYWPATSYPEGYDLNAEPYYGRAPYCAAAVAYWVKEWLRDPEVLDVLGMDAKQAEKWRCKSAGAFEWVNWARKKGIQVLNPHAILHAGDIVVYEYSHIEVVTDDDNTKEGPFVAIGANTNSKASRDGEGCYEKPRSRGAVKYFIRLLP